MATTQTFKTFYDLYTAVFEHARQASNDEDLIEYTKRWINKRYLQVQSYKKWKWRKTERSIFVEKRYTGTSCTFTQNSRSIVVNDDLTEEVATDWVGRKIYIPGQKEIYRIVALQSWTSPTASVTFILNVPFVRTTATNSSFFVFQDEFSMWPDFEDFDDVVSFYSTKEVRRVGPAKIKEMANRNFFRTGKAAFVSIIGTGTYPGVKLGEYVLGQEFLGASGVKKICLYPSMAVEDYILPLTFVKKAQEMTEDEDEPLMSLDDRIILVDGALADMYGFLKDDTSVQIYEAKFGAKLEEMASDHQEDDDLPQMIPDTDYRSGRSSIQGLYDFNSTDEDVITEI